jgi:hypothetical protein
MSLYFGKKSEACLETVALPLQHLARQALAVGLIDFAITEGFRPRAKQDEYYFGIPQRSKVMWPHSKHNATPCAEAFDAVPWVRGKLSYNYNHCCFLAGIILALSKKISVPIRWGGNWDMDLEPVTDQDFQDLVHYELVG